MSQGYGAQAESRVKLVLNSHTICRDKDGNIKWEADTVPLELEMGTFEVMGVNPAFQIDTSKIRTGKEHF